MPSVHCSIGTNGGYWMDLRVGNQVIKAMVDSGLADPLGMVGLEVQPAVFDNLERSGQVSMLHHRHSRTAIGQLTKSRSGRVQAQMVDPQTRQAAGPVVDLNVSRGTAGVQHRVGVVFFHRLTGCRVIWDLDQRRWCIEYP